MGRGLVTGAALTAVLAVVSSSSCGKPPPPVSPAPPVSYVGRDACRKCHVEIFATYAHTGMGRSWYPMTAAVAVEDFTKNNTLVFPATGLTYRMTRRGDRFFVKQFVAGTQGRELAADEREIVEVAGSGNHSRSYVTKVGDRRFQMPVCWYPALPGWDLCPGYEHKNDGFTRGISPSCVFCHNARMVAKEGEKNAFEEPIPSGIDCERCHGPGGEHVDKWQAGDVAPTGGADPTIVNPARLPHPRRLQVCVQCHFGDSLASERVGRHERPLESFRPGEPLTEVLVPFRYRESTVRDFGISAQADRFLLSRCYTASAGKVDCLTCHDPHVTVYREERAPDSFRTKCLGCHDAAGCKGDPGERRTTRPADDCVSCHMRRGGPDDHPHATFTDHWIRRDAGVLEPNERRSPDVEPVFADAFAALPASDRAFYTGRAYYLKATDAPAAVRPAMWAEAVRSFEDARRLGFAKADADYYRGRALNFLGRRAEAAEAFALAVKADPAHHDAAFARGQALLRAGDLEQAARVFEDLRARVPRWAAPVAELARCRMTQGRAAEALALYDAAIALEPTTAALHANRAMILAATGRGAEAVAAASEAVRCAPEDATMWNAYAEIAAHAGNADVAAEARRIVERLSRRPPPVEGPRGMMGMGN